MRGGETEEYPEEGSAMKHILVGLIALLIIAGASSAHAESIVVTFDDLLTPEISLWHFGYIPSTYAGLVWSPTGQRAGWDVGYWPDYLGIFGNHYNTPSMNNFAYNGDGIVATYIDGSPFNYVGGYFSTWAENDQRASFGSETITINGYSGNVLVGTRTWTLSANHFDWLEADFVNVTRLEFLNDGNSYRFWMMDNLTYVPTPEPASLLLLGTGLTGLMLAGWRMKK